MEISSYQPGIANGANLPLERLAENKSVSEEEKVVQLSKQFEAVLVRQILNQAQQPVFGGGAAGTDSKSAVYQDLFTSQLADQISASGKIGFAQALQTQLTRQLGTSGSKNAEHDFGDELQSKAVKSAGKK